MGLAIKGLAIKLATVFGLGMVELWAAIPAGSAMKLHPVATSTAAATGAFFGTLLVVSLGASARQWLLRRHGATSPTGRRSWAGRIWNRYGVPGLGLTAPMITGAPLGAALGVSLGAPLRRLLCWMALGIAFWSIVLTLAAEAGLAWLEIGWPWD